MMKLSLIYENHFLFLLWVTTLGFFISLIEATFKIKYEQFMQLKKREKLVSRLYP